jgi:acetyl esterase/lipase
MIKVTPLRVASVVLGLLIVPLLPNGAQGDSAMAQVGNGSAPTAPSPTFADLDYAPPEPATSLGHKLDLYLPPVGSKPFPVVVWTTGSAWLGDTGKRQAEIIAAQLHPRGFAVAGVSVRSSSQATFPAQIHDTKAAIRWLRANSTKFGLDPNRVGIMGSSSGGWAAAMAAATANLSHLEGTVGVTGHSSAVQAAVAFYPPTDFLSMDAWAIRRCAPGARELGMKEGYCHDDVSSPESRLVGCAIQSCRDKVRAADPAGYVSATTAPIMIFHGNSDAAVPHNQGERLYMAFNKICRDAVFVSLPKAGHGPVTAFLTDDAVREGATIRSTSTDGCTVTNPILYKPTWQTVINFLEKYLH